MTRFEAFQSAKTKRFILSKGKPFMVFRSRLNAYKEPTEEEDVVCQIKGVYHEASHSYMKETIGDQGRYTRLTDSMLLCMMDLNSQKIQIGDFLYVGQKKYHVTKKVDVNNMGIAYDISLEYKDDGSDA